MEQNRVAKVETLRDPFVEAGTAKRGEAEMGRLEVGLKEKVRVTIDFSRDFYSLICSLEEFSQIPGKAAVIRSALLLYNELLRQRAEGWTISLRNEKSGEVKDVLLPVLPRTP